MVAQGHKKTHWIWLLCGRGALNQKIPRLRLGGQLGQQDAAAADVGQVNGDPVIARGHGDIPNALNLKSGQVQLVRPRAEIRHGVRAVPGAEYEDVGAGPAGQAVIPGPAGQGVGALATEQPVVAGAAHHHVVAAARTAVQGVVAGSPVNGVVAAVTGQDVVKGRADEVLHVRQGVGLLCAALVRPGHVHGVGEGVALGVAASGGEAVQAHGDGLG